MMRVGSNGIFERQDFLVWVLVWDFLWDSRALRKSNLLNFSALKSCDCDRQVLTVALKLLVGHFFDSSEGQWGFGLSLK